jgi:hypothetical protein
MPLGLTNRRRTPAANLRFLRIAEEEQVGDRGHVENIRHVASRTFVMARRALLRFTSQPSLGRYYFR